MKRWFCWMLAALCLCCVCLNAMAEEIDIQPAVIQTPTATDAPEDDANPQATEAPQTETVSVAFEEGFALELPADWKYYPLSAEMAEMGVIYCLSDAAGERWMYIQSWQSECEDMEALLEVISAASDPENSGIRAFDGGEFIIYNIAAENVSCCAAMLGDQVLNFVFTPQNDMDYMAQAVQIIGTFREN